MAYVEACAVKDCPHRAYVTIRVPHPKRGMATPEWIGVCMDHAERARKDWNEPPELAPVEEPAPRPEEPEIPEHKRLWLLKAAARGDLDDLVRLLCLGAHRTPHDLSRLSELAMELVALREPVGTNRAQMDEDAGPGVASHRLGLAVRRLSAAQALRYDRTLGRWHLGPRGEEVLAVVRRGELG